MESYNENNKLDQGRIQEFKKKGWLGVASSKSLPPALGALLHQKNIHFGQNRGRAPPATPTSESAHVDKEHLSLKHIDCNHPRLIKQPSNQLKVKDLL